MISTTHQLGVFWHERFDQVLTVRYSLITDGSESQQKYNREQSHSQTERDGSTAEYVAETAKENP